jgi:hypothetical protein
MAGLCGRRGGESIRVLVRVLELVLADGVPIDQALTSSRMSETSFGSDVQGRARGTVIVSDLRDEDDEAADVESLRDSGLWGAVRAMGEGRTRGEGGVEGWAEARRARRGGTVRYCGNVGSSCRFGSVVGGTAGRGLLIRLWADGRSVPELAPRGNGRRESGRVGLLVGARGEERETTWLNSREYHNTSSSSPSSS